MTKPSPQFKREIDKWRAVDFPLVAQAGMEVDFVTQFRQKSAKGRAIHKSFEMPGNPAFVSFIGAGTMHSAIFFERFWQAPSVAAALSSALKDVKFQAPETFRWSNTVELAGALADALLRDGATSAVKAWQLSVEAAETLLGGDFDDAQVFVSSSPWSASSTALTTHYAWLIIRPKDKRIEVVLAADAG